MHRVGVHPHLWSGRRGVQVLHAAAFAWACTRAEVDDDPRIVSVPVEK